MLSAASVVLLVLALLALLANAWVLVKALDELSDRPKFSVPEIPSIPPAVVPMPKPKRGRPAKKPATAEQAPVPAADPRQTSILDVKLPEAPHANA